MKKYIITTLLIFISLLSFSQNENITTLYYNTLKGSFGYGLGKFMVYAEIKSFERGGFGVETSYFYDIKEINGTEVKDKWSGFGVYLVSPTTTRNYDFIIGTGIISNVELYHRGYFRKTYLSLGITKSFIVENIFYVDVKLFSRIYNHNFEPIILIGIGI